MIIWIAILAILAILFLTLLLIQIFLIRLVSLLAEQNSRISSLEKRLSTLQQKPTFYQKIYYHQGDIMAQEGEINITPQGDAIGVVVGSYNNLEGVLTKTSGDIANIANDSPQGADRNVRPMRKPLSSELEKPIEKDSENSTESNNSAFDQRHSLKMINPGSNLEIVPSNSDELLSDEP